MLFYYSTIMCHQNEDRFKFHKQLTQFILLSLFSKFMLCSLAQRCYVSQRKKTSVSFSLLRVIGGALANIENKHIKKVWGLYDFKLIKKETSKTSNKSTMSWLTMQSQILLFSFSQISLCSRFPNKQKQGPPSSQHITLKSYPNL